VLDNVGFVVDGGANFVVVDATVAPEPCLWVETFKAPNWTRFHAYFCFKISHTQNEVFCLSTRTWLLTEISYYFGQVSAGLRGLLKMSGGNDSCFVYAGDFNSPPTNPPYCFLQDGRLSPEVLASNPDKEHVGLENGEVSVSK
jgi:hypothetical protein